jgi:endonuclease III
MKSGKHAENLKSFVKRTIKESAHVEWKPVDPKRALVRAVLSADTPEARVDEAMAVIDREFVDLNELRVATELEMQSMLGAKFPDIERKAVRIVAILNAIFEKEGTLSFERLLTLGKKEVRAFLRDLPDMTPYVEGYLLMYGLESPAVPVDQELLNHLVETGVLEEGTTAEEAQKALETAMKAEEMHSFFVGSRVVVTERLSKRKKSASA